MKALDRLLSAVEVSIILIGSLLGLGLAVLQVVLRYVFSTGIHWLEAGSVTALVWAMLMGASRAVRTGTHPRVDLLMHALPLRARAALNTLAFGAALLLVTFYLADAVSYARFVWGMGVTHPEFGGNLALPFAILPVILTFFLLRYLMLIIAMWTDLRSDPEDAFLRRVGSAEPKVHK
ncbi:hypothetical protein B6V72_17435 [Thioclava sp. F34-6]|uniref:TRAP transporter small permease n=1 Tax=Thioclava sp. F34-6 TaxID=1973003 RepID=UPI000B547ECA|nr:TRAP transporter small permease [Thioclava sp. F34-6]OWY10396.1 hypothetical protein B6V72_17435 [Thioclava sp. F34-6]